MKSSDRVMYWLDQLKIIFAEKSKERKEFIKVCREYLNDPTAFNRDKCYRYAKGAFAATFLEGFVVCLALISKGIKDNLFIQHKSLCEIYGLGFEEVTYTCKIKIGENYPSFFDAETTTCYKKPIVAKDRKSVTFLTKTSTIGCVDNYNTEIKIEGDGIDLLGGKAKINKLSLRPLEKTLGEEDVSIEAQYSFSINEIFNNQEREINILRSGHNMFKIETQDPNEIEYLGFKLYRPAKKISLKLIFPKNIFKENTIPNIQVKAFEHSPKELNVDLGRFSSAIISNPTCKMLNNEEFVWESELYPMVGMKYVLVYSPSELKDCLR